MDNGEEKELQEYSVDDLRFTPRHRKSIKLTEEELKELEGLEDAHEVAMDTPEQENQGNNRPKRNSREENRDYSRKERDNRRDKKPYNRRENKDYNRDDSGRGYGNGRERKEYKGRGRKNYDRKNSQNESDRK